MVLAKKATVMFGAIFATLVASQDTGVVDVDAYLAQPDPQGCQLGPEICSCSLQASAGQCTKPLTSDQTPPGVCEQQDCTESYKCDCLGFELCQINTCGQWKPTSPLPEPVPDRFSCEYTPNISKCRNWEGFATDTFGADNGKDQATESLIESATDESETMAISTATSADRLAVAKALKDADLPQATKEEATALEAEVDLFMQAAAMCQAAVAEAIATSKAAYENQKQSRAERRAALEADALEKENEAKLADPNNTNTAEIKNRIRENRIARRAAATSCGTWAKKARDSRRACRAAKKRARELKAEADVIRTRCMERSAAIVAKYAPKS